MKCPVCNEPNLVMADRKGVEIDYCPDCRGVWLDRGELDKIIDRSAALETPAAAPAEPVRQAPPINHESSHEPRHRQASSKYDKKHRKKNRMGDLLGDIFDF